MIFVVFVKNIIGFNLDMLFELVFLVEEDEWRVLM